MDEEDGLNPVCILREALWAIYIILGEPMRSAAGATLVLRSAGPPLSMPRQKAGVGLLPCEATLTGANGAIIIRRTKWNLAIEAATNRKVTKSTTGRSWRHTTATP